MSQKLLVDSILWRNVPLGEFYNVERDPNRTEGGQGSLYFEIPTSIVPGSLEFLGHPGIDVESMAPISIQVRVIGSPSVSTTLEFHKKAGGRLRIARQNRQMAGSQRHPAWTDSRGFPKAPDDTDQATARRYFPQGGLRIYVAKTVDGQYYAGFTKGPRPSDMDRSDPMWDLYAGGRAPGGIIRASGRSSASSRLTDILDSWARGKNVLLYGPPGTGKTRILSDLYHALSSASPSDTAILLDPENTDKPFTRPEIQVQIPRPAKVVWTTFHQSYGYEDFVLGLRPGNTEDGITLQPWAGVLLDAALELKDSESEYKSVVIFVDEINRGNAARIFGEFMTFLDFDYREGGAMPLPIPLRQISYENDQSEPIYRPGGKSATIPSGFQFPKHVYLVATMNSVDRAAIPIDSALARRFDRIEVRPDLGLLAAHWGLDEDSIQVLDDGNWDNAGPLDVAYQLLDRLNVVISDDFGPEFELGHGLLMGLLDASGSNGIEDAANGEEQLWRALARIWDQVIFPQLEDRYSGRPEHLMRLLKVENPPAQGDYPWKLRKSRNGQTEARSLSPVTVGLLDLDTIKRSLRWLAK